MEQRKKGSTDEKRLKSIDMSKSSMIHQFQKPIRGENRRRRLLTPGAPWVHAANLLASPDTISKVNEIGTQAVKR